jgi:signal transduction histidine kinase
VDEILENAVDERSLMRRFTDAVVPRFADWCMVETIDRDGALRLAACTHHGGAGQYVAQQLHKYQPKDHGSPFSVSHALETGNAVLVGDVDDAIIDPRTEDPEDLRIYHTLGVRSAMFVPMGHGGLSATGPGIVGVVRFLSGARRRRYRPHDLRPGRALARRAARIHEQARMMVELAERSALRDVLLASASHELRTPLGVLMLSLQSMGDDLSREQLSRTRLSVKASRALRQAQRLVDLVENELDGVRARVGE